MITFFVDDSKRPHARVHGMGPLLAVGGIFLASSNLRNLNARLNAICGNYGFPNNEPFKWSPGRELWMHDNLTGDRRRDFYFSIIQEAESSDAKAIIAIEDGSRNTAIASSASVEIDIISLFFERVNWALEKNNSDGILIIDRPGGDRGAEDRFLCQCLDAVQEGTTYVDMGRIALQACTSSKLNRMLQLADVVTSCSLAAACGETLYAFPVFERVKRLFFKDRDRIGGVGFKMHPDYLYVNLYHWLLGDSHYIKRNAGYPLPFDSRPYATNPYLD